MADGRRVTVRDCAFVVPPPPDNAVVRDYAGGLGFEAASDYVLPPLDLLQLAALAHPTFRVQLLDLSFERLDGDVVAARIGRQLAGRLAVVQVSLPTLAHDVRFARALRAQGVRVVQRVQHLPPESLSTITLDASDEWLLGECEEVLCSVLLGDVPRNAYGPGTPPPQRPPDLDALPMPFRELARDLPYSFPRLGPCTTLQSSRGCPYSCRYYCPYPLSQGTLWRSQSAASVVEEVRQILDRGLATRILFRDAVFTLKQTRAQEICRGLRSLARPVQFWCETRADLLDDATIEELAASGCVGVNVGVETGDEDLRLRRLKSGVTDELLASVAERLRRHNVQLSLLMMVGWPGETRESLVRTGALVQRLRPRSVGFAFPTAYPGTEFHRDLSAGRQSDSVLLPTAGDAPQILTGELTSSDLVEARQLLMRVAEAAGEDRPTTDLADRQHDLVRWSERGE